MRIFLASMVGYMMALAFHAARDYAVAPNAGDLGFMAWDVAFAVYCFASLLRFDREQTLEHTHGQQQ